MRNKILLGVGVLVVALAAFVVVQIYAYPKAQIRTTTHQMAPDFTLPDAEGRPFTLASQRGHKVVLYFYRGYW
jgi:cytochrome oxidase Cu insertion factor (SCO1/SenC/PrrC family)